MEADTRAGGVGAAPQTDVMRSRQAAHQPREQKRAKAPSFILVAALGTDWRVTGCCFGDRVWSSFTEPHPIMKQTHYVMADRIMVMRAGWPSGGLFQRAGYARSSA